MATLNTKLSGSLIFKDQGTFLSEIRPGPNAITITGSLNVSGSRITLNGSDLGVRIATLEAGQGADQIQFGAITLWTASIGEWTGSTDERLYDLELSTVALGQYTSSNDIQVSRLFTSASTQDSRISSLELTSSIDRARITTLEDSELVSSSAQIDALGFLTASIGGIVSSSSQITGLGFITGSKFYDLDDIPSGIISSSVQIDEIFNLDGIISSSTQLETEISGAFAAPSASFSTRVTDLELFSSSLDDTYATDAQLTSLSSSVSTDLTDLSSSVNFKIDNINELSGSSLIGSDLLNIHSITGSVSITGSLTLQNSDLDLTGSFNLSLDGISKYFSIDVNGEEKVKVNEEGVFQLISQSSAPTAVEGGIYYGNDHNLYLGVNE